jgi:D-3-phosphoglycerate dehydrogenase
MKKKVLIPTHLDAVAVELLREHGGYNVHMEETSDLAALAGRHADAHALIVRSEKVDAEVIDAFTRLMVIVRAGAGFNTIDVGHARTRGVDVMNTPGANANAVAEEVIAMMLADARHVIEADISTRKGDWRKKDFMGREITGKVLGIVGLGYIGQTLVKRTRGFDMTVIGYDPVLTQERARELGVQLVELSALFEQSDYISLHLPENGQTRGLVDRSLLGLLKSGATIINCARAGIVNEADLRSAKQERRIRFLNDVYQSDEAGPKAIADLADLMMPHLGASTVEANRNAAQRAAQQLIEYDDKGLRAFVVNREVPAGLDEAYGALAYAVANLCRSVVGRGHKLTQIATSFYGSLEPFGEWLILPVAAAAVENFERSMDYAATLQHLRDKGVEYDNRTGDGRKGYENSITIDMVVELDDNNLRRASVRGTMAEGNVMISRINDFDKLYFDPCGKNFIVSYQDRPGVLGQIGAALAKAGINIDDVRNPHDSNAVQSLAWFKVNRCVPDDLISEIADAIEADIAVYAEL